MRHIARIMVTLTLSLLVINSFSQDKSESPSDEKVKTGWNLGGLPVVSFDSDLGFQYGALLNLFNYGDGSNYPDFNHNLYLEWSRFTKGSGINRLFFDTKKLIPGIRVTTDLSYLTDRMYDFFGYNGYESVYNARWIDSDDSNYLSRAFYKYDRKLFRFALDLQGKLPLENFGWAAGVWLLNYNVGPVDIDKLNEGKEEDLLPEVRTLYDHYVGANIISAEEAAGSFVSYIKAGVVYDTRDNEPNPNRGMWTEAVFTYAPSFMGIGSNYEHLNFTLTHRQYFTLFPKRLTLAYRLGYQGTLFGDVPFYLKPNITTLILRGSTSEGLGGGKSLRGIVRNRVTGNSIAWANLELRWKFVKFQFIGQNFYLSLNGFVDGGRVINPVDFNKNSEYWDGIDWGEETPIGKPMFFGSDKEGLHMSYGAGLRVVMNQNFIIALDHGRPFDKRDGTSGTYIGLNFLF
ncbi:MAG: BamA/TamA family outer membrane protein [Bacteroidales bacterium]|nr:BamA/TamA family outer membrane protein [Bacteroidales bacterium]